MPKMKSNRAAMKRFGVTASGHVKRAKAFKSHILTKKEHKRKRNLRLGALVAPADMKKVRRLLPGLC